ncbi:MAG: cupin, partial [Mycobacterium sp.]
LIVTTARLGRFFAEVGRPVTDSLQPPASEEVANFVAVSEKYGYVLGTPEENAAVGITMPLFTSEDG